MQLRKLIKTNARRALGERWTPAGAIALIALALGLLFAILEGAVMAALGLEPLLDFALTPDYPLDDLPNPSPAAALVVTATAALCLMLMAPFKLGVTRWFYRLGDARVEEVSGVFEFFGSGRLLLRSVLLRLSLLARCALWSVLFAAAPMALLLFSRLSQQRAATDSHWMLASALELAGGVLLLLAAIFWAVWCMRYYLADLALADDPEQSVSAAVRRSVAATRGRRLELLMFELSLVGWRLLDALLLPQMFTLPYRETARGLYARYLFTVSGC